MINDNLFIITNIGSLIIIVAVIIIIYVKIFSAKLKLLKYY